MVFGLWTRGKRSSDVQVVSGLLPYVATSAPQIAHGLLPADPPSACESLVVEPAPAQESAPAPELIAYLNKFDALKEFLLPADRLRRLVELRAELCGGLIAQSPEYFSTVLACAQALLTSATSAAHAIESMAPPPLPAALAYAELAGFHACLVPSIEDVVDAASRGSAADAVENIAHLAQEMTPACRRVNAQHAELRGL